MCASHTLGSGIMELGGAGREGSRRKGESICRYQWFRISEVQMGHRCFQKTTRGKICE